MSQKITFAEWVKRVEDTGRDKLLIAKDLNIEVASLYRYLANERVPSKAVMKRILAQSSGRVDIACFYTASEPAPELSRAS